VLYLLKTRIWIGLYCLLLVIPSEPVHAQAEQFDSQGVPINYRVKGDGPPVVLIHGFAVSGEANWSMADISDKLARDFKVIIVDVRGHGRSGKPLEKEQYGIEMVSDVVRLLDHLNIERADLVGYSMGGLITLKCAIEHPTRVRSFCIGGAGWLRPDQEEAPDFIEQVAKSLDEGKGPLPLLERLNPSPDAANLARIKTTNSLLKSLNNCKALAAVFRSLPQLAIAETQLRQCKVPGLFIVGTADPAPTSVAELKAIKPGNFEVVELSEADHLTTIIRPDFFEHLSHHLQRQSSELPTKN
jgi:pimeloyl-ACP methyl ester carboxylesterase